MRKVIEAIEGEFRRYQALAQATIRQLNERQLSTSLSEGGNSIAILVWHISGNLKSRYTDFLTTDGEKEWRDRDSEFTARKVTQKELSEKWNEGWDILYATLQQLDDSQLEQTVTVRNQPQSVLEAILRGLAHTSYHVGQMITIGKELRGPEWRWLSIPPGGSAEYNKNPKIEKGPPAVRRLE
jgi:uncharacterized damage-inducible protein DinB